MLKILLLSILIIQAYAYEDFDMDQLVDKISVYQRRDKKRNRDESYRYNYDVDKIEARKYTAVIRKGAIIISFADKKKYRVPTQTMVKVAERASGGAFSFIFDKLGEPAYLCESKDLENITEITQITPNKIKLFKKERIKFNYVDEKSSFMSHFFIGVASHELKPFVQSGGNSFSFSSEIKFNKSFKFPMYLNTNLVTLRSDSLSWDSFGVGFTLGYLMSETKTTSLELRGSAKATIFGFAEFEGQRDSLRNMSLQSSLAYKKNKYIIEGFAGLEKFIFSKDSDLSAIEQSELNSYGLYLGVNFGREFDL